MSDVSKSWYRKWWGIALIAVLAIGVIGNLADSDEPEVEAESVTTTTQVEEATTTTQESTTTTVEPTTTTTEQVTTTTLAPLTEEHFLVELVVIEDKCFGSAGATVTVEPDLTFLGVDLFGKSYLLIYEVSGTEYGTETFNVEINSDGTYSYYEERISTATCDHNLEAEVVGLRER